MRAAFFLILIASPAQAACVDGQEIFSCQIGANILQICNSKGALIYSFGPEGKPDLTIAEPLETVDYTPWPGIGGDIWETVTFSNAGVSYEVWTSVSRDPEATTGRQGGVRVTEGETTLAELKCNPDSAGFLDSIYDAKTAVGQCWNFEAKRWADTCPDG